MKVRLKGILKFVFFLAVGLLITWLSLRGLTPSDRADLMVSFRQVNPFWLVVVALAGILSHLLRALRWQMLLDPIAVKPSLRNTFAAVMTGYLANMAFPRLGEITRCGVLLTTDKIPVNRSLGTVVTERAIDTIVFVLLFFLMMLTQYQYIISYIETQIATGLVSKVTTLSANHLFFLVTGAGTVTVGLIVLILLRAKPDQPVRYKGKMLLLGFWSGLLSVRHVKRPLTFVVYSFAIWFVYFLMTWLCFNALSETASLGIGAGMAVLMLGTVGIVITPGGIGLYPVIARDTLMLYGVSVTTGFAMGWILWTMQTAVIVVAGIASILWLAALKRRIRNGRNEVATPPLST